jgi:taurine dioxygenase
MGYQHISVDTVTPSIGAEISGVNLAETLSDEVIGEVRQALLDHLVIFFRDQEMDLVQHKEFGARFGKLHIHPAAPKIDNHPEILVIHADEKSKYVAGNLWHSDVSCDAEPPMGSILHIVETPENGGGDTLFANMYAAYDALSERMKEYLEGLEAVHGSRHVYQGRYGLKEKLRDDDYPENVHPIVRTHPETGRRGLYVNRGFTTRILGVPREEGRAVLSFLWEHVKSPQYHCRFQWRPNSVAFWDNRCTQHHSVWDYYPQVRHGYRVTVSGDKPV